MGQRRQAVEFPTVTEEKDFKFEPSDKPHFVVMKAESGYVFVGGADEKLSKLDKDFKLIKAVNLDQRIWTGICAQKYIICGFMKSHIMIYDQELVFVKKVDLKNTVTKMLEQPNDEIILSEHEGNIEIFNLKTLQITSSLNIEADETITDITKISQEFAYAVGLRSPVSKDDLLGRILLQGISKKNYQGCIMILSITFQNGNASL